MPGLVFLSLAVCLLVVPLVPGRLLRTPGVAAASAGVFLVMAAYGGWLFARWPPAGARCRSCAPAGTADERSDRCPTGAQMRPRASIASATLLKPSMLAPAT
ncbi:hypothetical protein GCM10010116_57370 [Microbispora rosea subsp. aerata]|nr:hypothetical protein GCM10010116_57370 [Microbispora rosea subsp. aerata]GIH58871.1 hypothetical protein Mro02_57850 [Microbispora rosea subsp. aerata]GLJ85213.1 hypothetical protein GCM10017588_39410 [Microbispora rosea subsp. aerata]